MSKLINKLINQGQEYLLAGGGSKEGDKIEYLTEEEYEALTPEQKSDEDTTYMITGEGSVGPMGDIDDSQVKHLNEEGEEDGTVQEKLNSLKEESTNLTNKVNFLELNGGFFPLLADNVIYTGSSFSYTAEEDTMLFISDNSDTYLKIDGANIAGNYTPGYIFVGEGQTITYSRSCKVYKANNTIVIDDSNVTLGLMDNTYLGAVNFDDNKVASVNSAHLGNNKVATASGTGDLNFHFEHTFNTQHSKMDSAELVMSGDLTYGDMGTVKEYATFNSNFEEIDPIDPVVAQNGYFEEGGKKYAIKTNKVLFNTDSGDSDYWYVDYDIDLLKLDDNLKVTETTNKAGKIYTSSFDKRGGTTTRGRYICFSDGFNSLKINSSLNVVIGASLPNKGGSSMRGIPYKDNTYYMYVHNSNDYFFVSRQNKDGTVGSVPITNNIGRTNDGYEYCSMFVDINNDVIYLFSGIYTGSKRIVKTCEYNINTGVTTDINDKFTNLDQFLGQIGYCTVEGDKIIPITTLTGTYLNGLKIISKINNIYYLNVNKSEVYPSYVNGEIIYTIATSIKPTNTLSVNGNNAVNTPIIGYSATDKVTKLTFGKATFDTTDTVSIDVSIKNNSGTSKSVTLPKSGWSTSGNKTVGSGTSFTFNNN